MAPFNAGSLRRQGLGFGILWTCLAFRLFRQPIAADRRWLAVRAEIRRLQVQLHKEGLSPEIYGRNGGSFTRRFLAIATAVFGLPTKSCIVDGELIAAGRHGEPDFLALLHGRRVSTCVYCFDLLELNGRGLRELQLVQRRAKLQALLRRAKSDLIRFSESFSECGRPACGMRAPRPRGHRREA
jgi:hypothetical protein